jgi:hypothetical protein
MTRGGQDSGFSDSSAPASHSWATRIGFCDLRGTEVLWVGVCAPHGWNLTEISDARFCGHPKANSTVDRSDPPNFPKVAQSQAGFSRLLTD